jgi:hypothetical protein
MRSSLLKLLITKAEALFGAEIVGQIGQSIRAGFPKQSLAERVRCGSSTRCSTSRGVPPVVRTAVPIELSVAEDVENVIGH